MYFFAFLLSCVQEGFFIIDFEIIAHSFFFLFNQETLSNCAEFLIKSKLNKPSFTYGIRNSCKFKSQDIFCALVAAKLSCMESAVALCLLS